MPSRLYTGKGNNHNHNIFFKTFYPETKKKANLKADTIQFFGGKLYFHLMWRRLSSKYSRCKDFELWKDQWAGWFENSLLLDVDGKARKPFEAIVEERDWAKIYFFSTYEIVLEGALVDIAAAAQVNSPPSPLLLLLLLLLLLVFQLGCCFSLLLTWYKSLASVNYSFYIRVINKNSDLKRLFFSWFCF